MKVLSNLLNRISSWKSLLLFLAVYIFFNAYLLKDTENKINELAGKPVGIIDLTFGFNPQKSLNMVSEYGSDARSYYARTEMTTDILYPVVYTLLFAIILSLLFRKNSYSWLNVIPFFCLLLDYLENAFIVILLVTFPKHSVTIATFAETFKLLKWITFGSVILLTIFGLTFTISRKYHSFPERNRNGG